MSNLTVDRRKFLKMLGWGGAGTALTGCDLPTTITLEEGKEEVVSYLMPEEYVIPGIGVYYASTCTQCDAGCGIHGRVREGRPLKIEGNPDAPLNHGKTCMMGQAGLQGHYNPDRITAPMVRKGGRLETATWDEAIAAVTKGLEGVGSQKVAFVTGSISGHQSVLVNDLLSKTGSTGQHFPIEIVSNANWSAASRDMIGDAMPRIRLDKAGVVLSFGADFLATWVSPVHFAGEYAKFRSGQRGMLVQVEPKMSLTGGNSDLWIAARPGTEGALALAIANFIVERGWNKVDVPAAVKEALKEYKVEEVAELTGVEASKIKRIASLLSERAPALVLAGGAPAGGEHGYHTAAAAMLLNILMGAVGSTLEASEKFPEASLAAKAGNTGNLVSLAKALEANKLDVVFTYNTNPVYLAPKSLKLEENFERAKLKVAFATFPDETTLKADVVLPILSTYEDWGTHVAAYNGGSAVLNVQQPLMEPLHKDTRGFGDVMLSLLKSRDNAYASFPDFYTYIRSSMKNAPATLAAGQDAKSDAFWNGMLQKGVLSVKGTSGSLAVKPAVEKVAAHGVKNAEYPYQLIPSPRLGLWDGRHANIPWLQESPDQIAKVVWDSWVEMHPHTAERLGVKNGDIVKVSSAQGSVETQVYVHKGIHPEAIAIPLGQGHSDYGRYAKGRGVNPLQILSATVDSKTGELATYATRVNVAKTRKSQVLVKMGSSETQLGRKLVRTVSADVYRRNEGEA